MEQSWKTLFLLTFFCTFGLMTSAKAQIIPDNSLGAETSIVGQPNQPINGIPINQIDQINGGARRGGNLFHSFGEFNVNAGRGAYFTNPDGVGNILTRVTGVNRSNILGTLGVLGNANLFLINPNGIFFGPNASLDVRGSFFGSSANSLLFDNGFEFSATNPQAPPLLTVNIPIGLRFRDNPSNITNASSNFGLKVPSGQTLALVGGNVSMDGGQLNAYSGRVELGGLAEPGTLALSVDGDNLSLRFPDNVKRASVSLTNRSGVFVSGAGGGNIAVNAKNLDILGGSILSAGIGEGLGTPETVAGDITVNATGRVTINQRSRLSNRVGSDATGNAGNINIKAGGDISINNLGSLPALDAGSSGRGRSGNVSLQANGSIFVSGESLESVDSVISTFSENQSLGSGDITVNASGAIFLDNAFFVASSFGGNGGNISLQGNEISLENNSSLVSVAFRRGSSGSITLKSTGPISIQNSLVNTAVDSSEDTPIQQQGNAGDINISGRSVSVTGGSEISSRSLFRGVNAGNINVNATEFVEISGKPRILQPSDRASDFRNTILTTSAGSNSTGNAGNISIKAGEILINNQGRDPAISTNNSGQGRGGNVLLESTKGSIFVTGQNVQNGDSDTQANDQVISTFGETNSQGSGDISLNANGSISLDNAFLRASTEGGDAGRILVQGNERVSLANNSALTTEALGRGNAGPITVESFGPISLQNSLVATNVGRRTDINSRPELGNAGNIRIQGRSVAITAGSEISSRSFSGANSGNIEVNGTQFVDISGRASQFPRPGSDRANSFPYTTLATTSEQFARGASGNITVNTPNLRISDGASVRADTRSNSIGGSVNINANVVDITSGGQIFTTAFSTGNAGNIVLNVRDRLNISGSNPSIADIFNQIAQNRGRTEAEIQLGSPNSQAGIFANSSGTGQGGNLSITGNTLNLDRGVLSASTASGDGGNINLNLRNFIRLRNESLISADARGQQGGNGGNITINTPFIVAFPRNNDITANAGSGSGGRVIINATLFGIARLSAEDLRRLRPNDSDPSPRQIPTSDITAISRDNPSLSGNVQVNSPDVDPSRGLVELPETVTDTTQKVAQNPCRQGFGNEFVVTGRGGLPTSPNETLSSNNVRVDLLQPVASSGNSPSATIKPATNPIAARVPAQGWIFNDKGQVVLTAYDPTNTGSQRPFSTAACPAR
jgi:filamentous hemagglutinin family protein